jgi:hypothetical protein
MDLPEHDPALVADVSARATAEHAHHEAGHAVAAVARGGVLERITLGTADYSTCDESTATDGVTQHLTHPKNVPFVTFAGPWAEAMWISQHEPDTTLDDALDYAWTQHHGDCAKYEKRVEQLEKLAAELGFDLQVRGWESE